MTLSASKLFLPCFLTRELPPRLAAYDPTTLSNLNAPMKVKSSWKEVVERTAYYRYSIFSVQGAQLGTYEFDYSKP